MAVDAGLQLILDLMSKAGLERTTYGTPQELRERTASLRTLRPGPDGPHPIGSSSDITLPGPGGELPARVYRPAAEMPLPTVVFFHGGGFVSCDLDTHDEQCRLICAAVGAVVLSIDYRLAPEHPFPAAVEDCVTATRWAREQVATLGGDPARIAVAGDNAGGNLAAIAALVCRKDDPPLAAQLLIYPITDLGRDFPSMHENATGFLLTLEDLRWFTGHYLVDATQAADPLASPLRAGDLSGLPPALVVTAQYDPVRDQGIAYADALRDAGVPVIHRSYDGFIHGFFGMGLLSPAVAAAAAEICRDFAGLLA